MTIRSKILWPLFILLMTIVAFFISVLSYLVTVRTTMDENILLTQKVNDYSVQIGVMRQDISKSVYKYIISPNPQHIASILNSRTQISVLLSQIRPLIANDPIAVSLYNDFENSRRLAFMAQQELIEAVNSRNPSDIRKYFEYWDLKSTDNSATLLDFSGYNLHSLERLHSLYGQLFNDIFASAVGLTLICILLFTGIYLYLYRVITQPLELLSRSARQITRGHFAIDLKLNTNDEMSQLANDLHTMSAKIQSYYLYLKKRVKIKENQLKKSRKFEAQKDDFLSTASHELKTPVTSLKIYNQLLGQLAKKSAHPQYLAYVTKIDDQLRKLTSLTTNLLDVTRIQSGRLPISKTEFNLTELIESIIEIQRHTNPGRPFIFKSSSPVMVYADKDRIGQVVENLLANAVKYSPGNLPVTVKLTSADSGVTVEFIDRGVGIDLVHQKKIFTRYYRVAGLNQKTFPGLGVGLFLCRDIIKRHGGTISVKSRINHGSTFSIFLPKTSLSSTAKIPPKTPAKSPLPPGVSETLKPVRHRRF